MNENFKWQPGMSAPKNYPIEGYRIRFIYADGTGISWPLDVAGLGTGWGEESGGVVVGKSQKPIPIGLNITWLSYTENQFYTGSFKLPYDTMLELFKKGWHDIDGAYTYDHIITGMAPGGVVVVWLSGAAHEVDVCRFQATKTIIDMKDFTNRNDYEYSQADYIQSTLEDSTIAKNLAKNGIPLGLWDKYRQRFILRPKIVYDWIEPVKTQEILFNYYNGEADVLNAKMIEKNDYESRARPKKMLFYWYVDTLGKKQGYQLPIEFNEAEVMKAFAEVYGNNYNPENKIEGDLIVEVNRGNDDFRVFLQGNGKKVELHQSTGEIYLIN
jgi:hypothetical protein